MVNVIKNRNVLLVSVGFFFVFFGFSVVQQYLVPIYGLEGNENVALNSLLLVYIFFTLSGFVTPNIISRVGLKKTLVIASIAYTTFSIAALSANVNILYIFSILLGIAAPLLWTSGSTYIIRSVSRKIEGESLGFQISMFSLGSFIGVSAASILLNILPFQFTYALMAFAIFVGTIFFFFLKEIKIEVKRIPISDTIKMLSNPKLLLLMPSVVTSFLSLGLTFTFIPIFIQKSFSFYELTIAIFFMFLTRIISSYVFGRLSDRYSNKKILYSISIATLIGIYFIMGSLNFFTMVLSLSLIILHFSVFYPVLLSILAKAFSKKKLESAVALFQIFTGIGVILSILFTIFFSEIIIFYILTGLVFFSLLTMMAYFGKYGNKNIK